MTFPGPKQISGLVSSPLVLLNDHCQTSEWVGVLLGWNGRVVTAGIGSERGLQEERGGPESPVFKSALLQ